MKTISPTDFHQAWKADQSMQLLDVRTSEEYAQVHASMASLIPLQKLQKELPTDLLTASTPLYIICKSGARATEAANLIESSSSRKTVVVEGGTDAWVKQGLPSIRSGSSTMPIMQQVQVVVGVLILLGILLHFAVHPMFILLPAFVGAGLLFAGLTGTCGMAMMLGYMPWNKGPKTKNCAIPNKGA